MLPAGHRLRENREFRYIYARARSHVNPLAVAYVLKRRVPAGQADSAITGCRFGFVVSKKQGGAVVRNRIKRRIREAVHDRWDLLHAAPCDVIIVGRKRLHDASWEEVLRAIDDLMVRGGVMAQSDSQSGSGAR